VPPQLGQSPALAEKVRSRNAKEAECVSALLLKVLFRVEVMVFLQIFEPLVLFV
jgi:hypothetical protein